ncbi:MAG: transposase [Anaerolineae bacterium]|nr:transposase [Anaerolineae bacterium]
MPYTRLYYHITWGTRNREPLIQPSFEVALHRVMTAKVEELDGRVFAIGGVDDHVHLAVSIPAKTSVRTSSVRSRVTVRTLSITNCPCLTTLAGKPSTALLHLGRPTSLW